MLQRAKRTLTNGEQLMRAAKAGREAAEALRPGPERDALLRQARYDEAAARMDEWISSPGPTTAPVNGTARLRLASRTTNRVTRDSKSSAIGGFLRACAMP